MKLWHESRAGGPGGERKTQPAFLGAAVRSGLGLLGAGDGQAEDTGWLHAPRERAQVSASRQLRRLGAGPQGLPGGHQRCGAQRARSAGPGALEPAPQAAARRAGAAARGPCLQRNPWAATEDAEHAVLRAHTGACRFQKPIPPSQSLLLRSKD